MDRLTIQDAFAPYYAGRNSTSLTRDKQSPAEDKASLTKRVARALPSNVRLSDNEPESTTEH
jgi:hypothetical protein